MTAESVDWSSLHDAFGPAVAVPGLLVDIFDPDPEVRADASDDLWSRLCHQETVYPASVASVAPLLATARDPRTAAAERYTLLRLIVFIGRGEEGTWEGYTDLETVRAAERAVAAVVPEIVDWSTEVEEGEPEAAVVMLAASFGPAVDHLRRTRLRSTDPRLLAARDLAIRLADGPTVTVEDALRAAACDPDLVDFVRETALGRSGDSVARSVILELAEAAASSGDQ